MDKYEIVFVEGMEDDFLKYGISQEQIVKIRNKVVFTSKNMQHFSELIKGVPYKVRKMRFGDYRLFLYIKNFAVYCLAYVHRRECYKRESINKIVQMVKSIEE